MRKNNITVGSDDLKKIYRKAKPVDIDKWKEAIDREHPTMMRTRKNLGMTRKNSGFIS